MMTNKDYLGYYLVGWKKFFNKTLALIESNKTGYDLKWIFNDDVYSSIDWKIPIELSLKQLYALRAKQIREKYDYIALHYSGGVDSHNVLKTFLDNNLLIDELIIQTVEPIDKFSNDLDKSFKNLNSEIKYAAIPMLNGVRHKLDSRTKINFQDITKSSMEVFKHDNWIETFTPGSHYSITMLGKQALWINDPVLQNSVNRDQKICCLYGVDKPLVVYIDSEYYAYFTDSSAMHVGAIELNNTDINNIHTEFFYWSRDLPELVIKQAQEIKAVCEIDPIKKELWSKSIKIHVGEFRSVMNPIIYPETEVPSFQTKKPENNFNRGLLDSWFWETATDSTKANLVDGIRYLKNNIDINRFIGNDISLGLFSTNTKFYKL
jgi:hypothetical protein